MFASGECEVYKGGVHAAVASQAAAMALYNLGAYAARRERRLLIQGACYLALCGFEWWQTFGHWSAHRR